VRTIGIARRIDDLGRIVVPVEFRRLLGLRVNDELEIAVEGDHIVMTKADAACVFCGTIADLHTFKGKEVCGDCKAELSEG
jgi:transcriptional pleiotropic regulator of transition state genes